MARRMARRRAPPKTMMTAAVMKVSMVTDCGGALGLEREAASGIAMAYAQALKGDDRTVLWDPADVLRLTRRMPPS